MTTLDRVQTHTLEDLVTERWSCRAYRDGSVPHDTIVQLLELAQKAPSWCNTQPWEVIVTEGEGTERFRRALIAHASDRDSTPEPDIPIPAKYAGVHLERRRESGWQLYEAVGIARGDREASAQQALKNFELFGAPHAAIITIDTSLGAYAALDTGVYVANFLLAAHSFGLAAIPQAALALYSPFIRDYFAIADDRSVLLGISFGYPDQDHPANSYRTNRAGLEQVVRWVND
ncbi:nitroreductase [Nocardioides sp. NPDC051685]|uniref:nitroreductase n=1 Tax=Nocardioides sp. NPDC051685 TaxID=3364334 RepID=UPI0037B2EA16